MSDKRKKQIYMVTLEGGAINLLLLVFKFVAGFLGHSAAMIADAVHSLSDFATDIIVLIFTRLAGKPRDKDHDYGHGKYETLATTIIGIALFGIGIMILYDATASIIRYIQGEELPQPGWLALIAAITSIIMKEFAYRITVKVGRKYNSSSVIANAWHHRSDAMSSIGTGIGISGAILLGTDFRVLDPLAAAVVSLFIMRVAYKLLIPCVNELLESSLPEATEAEIMKLAAETEGVTDIHNLKTRRIGNTLAIEMHIRLDGKMTLNEAHTKASEVEQRLRKNYGEQTHIGIHIEPIKENGKYRSACSAQSKE